MAFNIKSVGNQYTNSSSRDGHTPCLIVDHISAGTWSSLLSWFTTVGNKVSSSNFGVSKKGEIVCFVPVERMAWANGIDALDIARSNTPIIKEHIGINPNKYSVSIEHEGTDGNLTEEQFNATVWLHKYIRDYIREKWGYEMQMSPFDIIGHFQVNPVGKPHCPGKFFPWNRLFEALQTTTDNPTMYEPQIVKERIYAENGLLKKCDGNYKISATDVRWIKFDTGKTKYRCVYREGAKVSDLVKEYGADFGFNFPFFWEGKVLGDAEDDDKVISAAYGHMLKWHEFAVVDGKPIIGQIDKNEHQDLLVQAAPLLIDNGNPCWDYYRVQQEVPDDIGKSEAQRTFIGIDANGDLILAIADGRTRYDRGLTLEEMCLFMQSKGAVWSLNGDGGSSTIVADKNGGLNQDLNTGENERSVHHAILVFIDKEDEGDMVLQLSEDEWLRLNGILGQRWNNGEITDWKWMQKIRTKSLTVGELAFLNSIMAAKKDGLSIEPNSYGM